MTILTLNDALQIESNDAQGKLALLLEQARGLIVDSEGAFATVTSIYAQARQMEKLVNDRLKEANRPAQDSINANKDIAQSFLTPIKEIIGVCNNQTNQWRARLETQKREEAPRSNRQPPSSMHRCHISRLSTSR